MSGVCNLERLNTSNLERLNSSVNSTGSVVRDFQKTNDSSRFIKSALKPVMMNHNHLCQIREVVTKHPE